MKPANYQRALKFYQARQFQQAEQELIAFLQANHKNADAHHLLAIVQFFLSKFDLALNQVDAALAAQAKPEFFNTKANILLATKDYSAAEQCYRRAIAENSRYVDAFHNLAIVLKKIGKAEEAIRVLEQCFSFSSETASALNTLGQCYWATGDLSAAEDALLRAVSLNKDFFTAKNNLLKLRLERYGASPALEDDIRALLVHYPKEKDAHVLLGDCLRQGDKFAEAEDAYNKALSIDPNNGSAHNDLGLCLLEQGKFELALKQFELACGCEEDVTNQRHINRMVTLVSLQRLSEMKIIAEALLRENPGVAESHAAIAIYCAIASWILGKENELRQCIGLASILLDTNPVLREKPFIAGYCAYLRVLIEIHDWDVKPVPNCMRVAIIGDSHILTLLHRTFRVGQQVCEFVPYLIIGCKMWHLIAPQPNRLRSAFEFSFKKIANRQIIAISVGEIDCRVNEGIILQVKEKGATIDEMTKLMAQAYLEYLTRLNASMRHTLLILGIPAPVDLGAASTTQDAVLQREIIVALNKQLALQCESHGCYFVDVYSHTVGPSGLARPNLHLDGRHLRPQVYQNTFDEINIAL